MLSFKRSFSYKSLYISSFFVSLFSPNIIAKMAQKSYARSLRNPNQSASDFSFFAEKDYAFLWKKTTQISMKFLSFCEKNFLYKKKNKTLKKNKNKRYKYKTFYKTRFFVSNLNNGYNFCPILFKFQKQSLSNKYNPIKAMYNKRRFNGIFKKRNFQQKSFLKRVSSIFSSFFKFNLIKF